MCHASAGAAPNAAGEHRWISKPGPNQMAAKLSLALDDIVSHAAKQAGSER